MSNFFTGSPGTTREPFTFYTEVPIKVNIFFSSGTLSSRRKYYGATTLAPSHILLKKKHKQQYLYPTATTPYATSTIPYKPLHYPSAINIPYRRKHIPLKAQLLRHFTLFTEVYIYSLASLYMPHPWYQYIYPSWCQYKSHPWRRYTPLAPVQMPLLASYYINLLLRWHSLPLDASTDALLDTVCMVLLASLHTFPWHNYIHPSAYGFLGVGIIHPIGRQNIRPQSWRHPLGANPGACPI